MLHLAQRLALRQLRPQLRAELRLAARAAQEDHQVPGDGQRRLPAHVLLDQRQRQVDARGDPGRGDDGAVPDIDGLRVDDHLGKLSFERAGIGPVRGHAASGQQPGPGKQEGSRAHRGDPPRPWGILPQPAGQLLDG